MRINGLKLKNIRLQQHYTQQTLATKASIAISTLSKLEYTSTCSEHILKKICDVLKIKPHELEG